MFHTWFMLSNEVPRLARSSIIGALEEISAPIQSRHALVWFDRITDSESPVEAICPNACSIAPALSLMAPMFSENRSFCSPVNDPSRRSASALPNSCP